MKITREKEERGMTMAGNGGGFRQNLAQYLNAGYSALYCPTHEEGRALDEIRDVAKGLQPDPRTVWAWSHTRGWVGPDGKPIKSDVRGAHSPTDAIRQITQIPIPEETILVLLDFHPFLGAAGPVIEVIRLIRDVLPVLSGTGRTLILLTPIHGAIPPELQKDLHVLPGDGSSYCEL